MKAWFIFNLNGRRVGVFVNSDEDGEKLLRKAYGDESIIEFIGIDWFGKAKYEHLHLGMSPVDSMISSGWIMLGMFSKTFRSM